MRVITKRSITFLISDFLDTKDFSRPLLVAARKHDLVGLRVFDPRMAELPDVGLLKVVDAETGHEQYVDTSSRIVRDHQKRWWALEESRLSQLFRMNGVDFVSMSTEGDYVRPLMNLFAGR